MNNHLMVIDPQTAIEAAQARYRVVAEMWQRNILRPGTDFGVVPGTNKASLLKAGAERLCAAFGFNPRFDEVSTVEKWDGDEPLFYYRIRCTLVHIETGAEVATGIGSCNSRESKYRWRWVKAEELPPYLNPDTLLSRQSSIREFAFAIKKAETGGKYGKPAAYWQRWQDAIDSGEAVMIQMPTRNGTSDGFEIAAVEYRVPNEDIFSLVNTIDKIAQKRALIAAVLIGANASEFFTQDVEDLPEFGGMVDDNVITVTPEIVTDTAPQSPQQAQGATQTPPPVTSGTKRGKNPYEAAQAKPAGNSASQAGWELNDASEGVLILQVKNILPAMPPQHVVNKVKKMRRENQFANCATFDDAKALAIAELSKPDMEVEF